MAATAQHANVAPISWPNCWRAGGAPTRKPVFRSCEMSPAFEPAMATIVATVSTAERAPGPFQPIAANTEATPSSVMRAMPEVGCEVTPTIPTIRAATVTNSTPKTPTPAAQTARCAAPIWPAKMPGTSASTTTTNTIAPITKEPCRSRSVFVPGATAAVPFRIPRATATNAPT